MIEAVLYDYIENLTFTNPDGALYQMPVIDPIWSPPACNGKDKITFFPISTRQGNCIEAADSPYQFDVWCKDYVKAKRIADTLILNLDKRSLKDCFVYFESGKPLKEDDFPFYRWELLFRVIHKRGE